MYLCLIVLPLIGSIISGFFGRKVGVNGAQIITIISVILTAILSYIVFTEVSFNNSSVYLELFKWIDSESIKILWGFNFDSLTASMLIPVLTVSSLVHVYSVGYMSHDPHNQRFFSYLSLFTFMMIILVTANNFLLMFVGWEGVGICSYLLVNFWFTRIAANQSSISALLTNRVGDCFLTIGMFILLWCFGNIDYTTVFSLAPFISENIITLIGICLLIGAMAKSSQFGLHVWLPMAMEGPTPVSALIHAATMVTAGVYLLMRCSPLIEYSPTILAICLLTGAITTLVSSVIGLFQQDIKKIIAYSTMSQLGMMVIAIGLSSYSIALFHLVNHAFYKALLFLGAGSIIHALDDNQDLRKYGGLKPFLPLTYSIMLIACLSLIAFPFMTGFYSKDMILESAYGQYTYLSITVYFMATLAAMFTSLYSVKILYLTFISTAMGSISYYRNAHEGDMYMNIPLIILALFSIFFGYITKDLFIGLASNLYTDNGLFIHPMHEILLNTEFAVAYIFKLLPLILTILASIMFVLLLEFFPYLLTLINYSKIYYIIFSLFNQRFYIEMFYNNYITNVILKLGGQTSKVLDKGSVELAGPHGLEIGIVYLSKSISKLDTGVITSYALYILIGLIFYVTIPYIINNSLLIILFTGLFIILYNKFHYHNNLVSSLSFSLNSLNILLYIIIIISVTIIIFLKPEIGNIYHNYIVELNVTHSNHNLLCDYTDSYTLKIFYKDLFFINNLFFLISALLIILLPFIVLLYCTVNYKLDNIHLLLFSIFFILLFTLFIKLNGIYLYYDKEYLLNNNFFINIYILKFINIYIYILFLIKSEIYKWIFIYFIFGIVFLGKYVVIIFNIFFRSIVYVISGVIPYDTLEQVYYSKFIFIYLLFIIFYLYCLIKSKNKKEFLLNTVINIFYINTFWSYVVITSDSACKFDVNGYLPNIDLSCLDEMIGQFRQRWVENPGDSDLNDTCFYNVGSQLDKYPQHTENARNLFPNLMSVPKYMENDNSWVNNLTVKRISDCTDEYNKKTSKISLWDIYNYRSRYIEIEAQAFWLKYRIFNRDNCNDLIMQHRCWTTAELVNSLNDLHVLIKAKTFLDNKYNHNTYTLSQDYHDAYMYIKAKYLGGSLEELVRIVKSQLTNNWSAMSGNDSVIYNRICKDIIHNYIIEQICTSTVEDMYLEEIFFNSHYFGLADSKAETVKNAHKRIGLPQFYYDLLLHEVNSLNANRFKSWCLYIYPNCTTYILPKFPATNLGCDLIHKFAFCEFNIHNTPLFRPSGNIFPNYGGVDDPSHENVTQVPNEVSVIDRIYNSHNKNFIRSFIDLFNVNDSRNSNTSFLGLNESKFHSLDKTNFESSFESSFSKDVIGLNIAKNYAYQKFDLKAFYLKIYPGLFR